MDAVAELERARGLPLVDEDGNTVELVFAPGLAPGEIEALEAQMGVPLPRDLVALLGYTAGIDGLIDQIDFTGRETSFEMRELLPSGLPIAHDGFGNFWVLDLTPEPAACAPVFFACHDAPVLLYQSPDLGHFVHELIRLDQPPHRSLVDDVHEDRIHKVWRTHPGVLDHATAIAADPDLSAFAAGLDERFQFVDLRDPEIGMGIAWGRFGRRTELRRDGYRRLFAYAPPPKPGLLSRLRNRGQTP